MLPKFTRTSLLVAPNSRPEQSPSACFYRASSGLSLTPYVPFRIHIYLSPICPNSVLKIGSHPVPHGRQLGFENVQDDVARRFLFDWSGASRCDHGCCAGFFSRRARAG